MAIITDANIPTTGIGGPSPAPDYTPPSIIWKDADEIYVPKGRYYKAGYRFGGQYQDLSNLSAYWDVADSFAVDIDATYSAGSTSGMLGGDVASSWYSVFMVDSDEILLLPFIRVDAISYSAPSTTINPAAHADGTTAENGFVTANDIFNTYRLVLLNDDPTENGNVYTIADCTTGTPDTIVITGDITGDVAATEWLQMIPPDGTTCLYLGFIRINSSGDLAWFKRNGWRIATDTYTSHQIDLNKATSASVANTDLGAICPPVVDKIDAQIIATSTTSGNGIVFRFYSGSSGTNQQVAYRVSNGDNNTASLLYNSPIPLSLTSVSLLRNHAAYVGSAGAEAAIATATIGVAAWYE